MKILGKLSPFKMEGELEVILEDRNGNVKQRESVKNTITNPYLKWVLFQLMSGPNLVNITRATASGSQTANAAPTIFGIYVMSEPITVTPETCIPPYVDESRAGLHPSVTFYNANGGSTESTQEMIPVDSRCYYNRSKLEYTMEFVKNTYAGVVRSVAIGRSHSAVANHCYVFNQKDIDMPTDLYSTTANYVLEHTANDGTILRKPIGTANEVVTVNLKTKMYSRDTNANAFSNITSQFGALAMNGHLFKVAKKTASGGIYTVTLTYLKDYLTEAGTATNLDIAIPTRDGMTAYTGGTPVLVTRAAQNKIEIFVAVSVGSHGGQFGANIKKVIVDVSDMENIAHTIEDMGIIPYVVSGYGTNVGQYLTGLFHGGKYYLPYGAIIKADGTTATGGLTAAYQEGIVISSDFSTVHNVICYRREANINHYPVISDANEVIQIRANTTAPHVAVVGQLVSGVNLENPITKAVGDVLRVIYRYRIS
jgi:hypothetical protein